MIAVHEERLAGMPVRWLEAPGSEPPALWLHGVPDSAELWTPFLERIGGIAVDLPGFGRSGKPADFPYSIDGYVDWLARFLAERGLERVCLGMHDWGGLGIALARRRPELVARLLAINVVPLGLTGLRWHRIAQVWRTPVLGELAMGFAGPWALRRGTGLPAEDVQRILQHFDQGTQRAILRLYRGASGAAIAAAGGPVDAPALVAWGDRDPFLDAAWADRLASSLGGAEVVHVSDAGHWPWRQRPDLVERAAAFLTE